MHSVAMDSRPYPLSSPSEIPGAFCSQRCRASPVRPSRTTRSSSSTTGARTAPTGFSPNGPQGTIGSACYHVSIDRPGAVPELCGVARPRAADRAPRRRRHPAAGSPVGAVRAYVGGRQSRPLGRVRGPDRRRGPAARAAPVATDGCGAAQLPADRKSVRSLHRHDAQIGLRRGRRLSHRAQALRGLRSLVPDRGRHRRSPIAKRCWRAIASTRARCRPGRPIRLAIADTCIIAAARAREAGAPEPFSSGRPTAPSARFGNPGYLPR